MRLLSSRESLKKSLNPFYEREAKDFITMSKVWLKFFNCKIFYFNFTEKRINKQMDGYNIYTI